MNGKNEEIKNKFEVQGGTVYYVPSDLIQYCEYIKELLQKNKYDIVHIHKNSAANIILPLLVKRYSKAKIIIHSHNSRQRGNSLILKFLHKCNRPILNKLADSRLACSDLAAEWLFNVKGNNQNIIKIIKNGIIVKKYIYNEKLKIEKRQEFGVQDNEIVLGHIGRFQEQKNHKFLINLIKELNNKKYKLILVGSGPLMDECKNLASLLEIENQVIFLGERSDIPEVLMAMDIFIMPSFYEGFPVASVEAQASGLNVLLSDKITKMVKLTERVSFLNIEEKEEWINAISELKDFGNREHKFHSVVEKGYDMKVSALEVMEIYRQICNKY